MAALTEAEYKLAKEQWVRDLSGGSTTEINMLAAVLLASYYLWFTLASHPRVVPTGSSVATFVAEYLLLTVPILVAMTLAADHLLLYFAVTAGAAAVARTVNSSMDRGQESEESQGKVEYHVPFISVYRAVMMLMTCAAILAVDFPIFPRRFAKVETFGTSLMDLGVGTFVFSSGVVAARMYLRPSTASLSIRIMQSARSALPALILGVVRILLTKGVDYQEHVSEYGTHWNFFFTLGLLPPFVTLIATLRPPRLAFGIVGIVIGLVYQLALHYGLQNFILEHPRVGIVSANKEGICSFFGYLSIFLLGLDTGTYLLTSTDVTTQRGRTLLRHASVFWALYILWTAIPTEWVEMTEVSRRMANLPYVLWVVAFNLSALLAFCEIEKRGGEGRRTVPRTFEAMNANGLWVFGVANLLTGLANLSMRTLYAPSPIAFAVCTAYLAVVTGFAWVLWVGFGVRIRV